MDSVDLEQLRTFVSPDIFVFLAAGNEPHHATPTEVEHPNPLEAELVANPLEEGLDALLLACSDMYELNAEAAEPNAKRLRFECVHENSQPSATTSKRSFAPPKTQQEMCKAKLSAIPASTAADTKYCVKIWNQWCSHRLEKYGDMIPPLDHPELTVKCFAENLSSFVFEV